MPTCCLGAACVPRPLPLSILALPPSPPPTTPTTHVAQRGHDNTGVTDRVVNQLLTELDGVEGLRGEEGRAGAG